MMNSVRAVSTAAVDKNPRNFDTLRPEAGRRFDAGSTGGM